MKRILWLAFIGVSLMAVAGCGDDPVATPGSAATELTFVLGDKSVTLMWDGETGEDYTEFYIFAAPRTADPTTLTAFRTTTANEITITGLSNDQLAGYTYHVRTVHEKDGNPTYYGDNSTNDVKVNPRPEGTGKIIWEFASPADNNHLSAFDFSGNKSLSMDFPFKAEIDVYLGTGLAKANGDSIGGTLALKSPDYVKSSNNWADKITRIVKHTGSFDDPTPSVSATTNSFAALAEKDGVYHFCFKEAVDGQNRYAKLQITNVLTETVSGKQYRKVEFKYAYQRNPNIAQF